MSTMIERVAKALAVEADDSYQDNQIFWQGYARAAVKAMRTPTAEMIDACEFTEDGEHTPNNSVLAAQQCWESMIDEALKP